MATVADGAVARNTVRQIDSFTKSKNIALEYFYDTANIAPDGYYQNGKLSVNLASQEGAYYTAVHEYMHYLEETAPHLLADYLTQVDKLIATFPKYKQIANKTTELYRSDERTRNISPEDLRNEIAFKITKHLIDNPSEFNAIVRKDLSIAQRLRLWLRNLLNRLNKTSLTPEKQAVRTALTALETAIKNEVKTKDAVENNNRKYSLNKSFSEQVDDVINNKYPTHLDLYVSKTPKVLLDIGFENKPMLMRNSKVKEILKKHPEMSINFIKNIPEAIIDPILILKSKTNPTESVVMITDIKTDKGEMIVPIWINQDGTYLDIELQSQVDSKTNFVATAYGRSTKALLEYALDNNGFLYENTEKKKVKELFNRHGLQLPAPLNISDFTTIIPTPTEKSNTFVKNSQEIQKEGKKSYSLPDTDSNGKKLTAAQQEYFKDSKVVDKQGRLLEVYHGTNAEFTIFDKAKQNINEPSGDYVGKGFYFAKERATAQKYGYKVNSYHIDIQSPLVINNKADANNLYSMFVGKVDFADEAERALAPKYNGLFEYMELKKNNPEKIQQYLIDSGYDGLIDNLYGKYAVFSPSQIKLTTNLNPTASEDIRFSLSDIDNYTETQYNNYGWVKVHDVLKAQEFSTFLSKIGELKKGVKFVKTYDNKYIIPTGDRFGINNVLIYTNGNYSNPSIDKIVKINLNNETNIDIVRSQIYDYEKAGVGYAKAISTIEERIGTRFIDTFEKQNYNNYKELKRQRQGSRAHNGDNQYEQDRSRNNEKNKGLKYSLPNAPYKADIITNVYEEIDGKRTLVRKEFKDATVTEKDGYY